MEHRHRWDRAQYERTKGKRGDSLDTAGSGATGNMPGIALIMNKSCSLISSLYPVLQLSQETISFPRKKWKRSLWPFNWNLSNGGCDKHCSSD